MQSGWLTPQAFPLIQSPMSPCGESDHAACELTLTDLEYELPAELVAQTPAARRESARLLIARRSDGTIEDGAITDLPDCLRPQDLLVLNDTKVVPAKLTLRRLSGGRVRGLFLEELGRGAWRVMLEGSRRLRVGERLSPPGAGADAVAGAEAVVVELAASHGQGEWSVRVTPPDPAEVVLERIGRTPLPPYIKRDAAHDPDAFDRERYQTVYAARAGAAAAPTAGLHLGRALLSRIDARGVARTFVTLHVGLGTFKPIDAARLADHRMHSERFELSEPAADALAACRRRGGRIVAVGTTSVRVLETAVPRNDTEGVWRPARGATDVFIRPPYEFRGVDALLTNFHLPKSTLLALVMAFGGIEFVRACYAHAVKRRYRFYSYGDAMLII